MAVSTSSSPSIPSISISISISIAAFSIPSCTTSLSLHRKKQKGRKHPWPPHHRSPSLQMLTSHSSSLDGILKHTSSLCIHHNLPWASPAASSSTSLLHTSQSFSGISKKSSSSSSGIRVHYPSVPLCFDSRGASTPTTSVCCTRKDSLLQRDYTEISELPLQDILQRISFALGVDDCPLNAHFTAKGRQACFGLEGDWQLTWCLDGRFYEHFNSEEMEFQYGFDGKESPWHADTGGHVSDLELDNLEACLLASWIRTGYWVTEQGQKILLIKKGKKQCLVEDPLAADEIWLSVSLKGKKVETHILVDSLTWLPRRMELKAFGGIENWEFIGWENVTPEVTFKFPVSTFFFPAAGGKHLYKVENDGISCNQGQQNPCFYTHPSTSILPRNSANSPRIQLDKSCSPSVKMIPARSGHHLVSPLIDGVNMGYFIVDTGASGLVISGKKADEVNMGSFGEAFITGVEGNFKTCFRKGKSFQLGPFTIHNPIFIQAPSDEVVRGVTETISGICGYDIFCQTIVEMASAEFRMSFYDPLLYKQYRSEIKWEDLYMLDNTPHAVAKFKGHSAIFMLDTGAGGIDIIFHKRAVEKFNLNASLDWRGVAEVTGLGTGSKGIKVEQGILDLVEFAGHTFSRVRTLHFSADEQALDISIYTSGVLCGELILKHIAIFDYQSRRFALVQTQ